VNIQAVKDTLVVGAFGLGCLILGAYGVTEALARIGYTLGAHECDHGFPWGQAIIGVTLIVPMTLGLTTAQKLAEAVASRFGGEKAP
jgi:hypothetical protein